ncbi:hypothetical protein [Chryseolinea lacunae]|uniref:HEAT repeat domain-containing protein n=1 Tax=Chryseolinea lacunae TaxID=2801331 RepID=A0ABS1KML6_9BACT|nr:hypothetical protein [Chryseolinea lacunae]MBL0740718.1 hypothetical protein [Chryseolinea lacunae]
MKFLILISFVLASLQVSAQSQFNGDKLSNEAKGIVSLIENDDTVPSNTMGLHAGYLPKDYPLTLLREKLTIEELVELTNHNSPIVRWYGFKALTQRSENAAFQVITSHLQDTIQISTYSSCLERDEFVGDYFLDVFRGHEAISHDSLHSNTLDSLLIFTPNKLEARNWAIRRAGKKLKYYSKIREVAITDRLAGAVIALANFKRAEDADIIMEMKVTGEPFRHYPLATTFFAISKFPHPKFLPFLEDHLQQIMSKPPGVESSFFYQAISNYNNKQGGVLLARGFQINDKALRSKHLEELSRALTKNSNPIYKDLRKRITTEAKFQVD